MIGNETELLGVAVEAARKAGEILLDWSDRFSVREKNRSDLVTEADFASQERIHGWISRAFPTHGFLGEEGLATPAADSGYRWIIDPLDGTSNYVHGFPYFAVSIALEFRGELILGVVYNPVHKELFTAFAGSGAFRNGERIQTSVIVDVSDCFCVASLPVATRRDNPAVERFLHLLEHAQTVQRTGSAALNLANVAAGRMDAFWSTSLKPWDMAAGVVLVREAGGCISSLDGGMFHVEMSDLLAVNNTSVQGQLIRLLQEAEPSA